MTNSITSRFLECLELIKSEGAVRSYRQFAQALDFHPQSLNEILRGNRNVTIGLVEKAVLAFDFNPIFLCKGEGPMINNDVDMIPEGNPVVTIVTSKENKERIVHVPIAAQAGYRDHIHDPVFFEELPTFSLPDQHFQTRTQRCFDVSGDSMEPVITSGEKIICSFVDPDFWSNNIKSSMVYVVVTQEEILVKRVINNLATEGQLILCSDNPYYEDIVLSAEEIKEVWIVTLKLSNFSHNKTTGLDAQSINIDQMKETMNNQSELIENLNKTIEKLLKQNRVMA